MSMGTFHVSIGLAACLSILSVAALAADARGLVWTDGSELPLDGQGFHEGIQPCSRLSGGAYRCAEAFAKALKSVWQH